VRLELAEDLTARAVELCVPLREQPSPEHVRALTSRHVLDVEADLLARLAARGAAGVATVEPTVVNGLDAGQRAAVTALAGDARLVVVEGAAGAGKTTTLAAAREALAARGHRLLVVTPTLKAAQAATAEVGTRAGSAAWLAWQHGWRWDATGAWTRTPTDPLPEARLRTGDLLLVDEAGMLDQDTARALVTIADETGARVALVGDRHQLPAVGRGGVLDLAHRQVHPVTAFSRDRADLGPAAAGRAAERAAGGYIPAGQPPDPDTLADVLHELRDAWSARLTAHWQLQRLQERLARVQAQAAWEALCQQTLAPLETLCDAVRVAAQQAEQAATGCATVLAEQHTARLRRTWDAQLLGADQAARAITAGGGRLGLHRGRVRDAKQHLDAWAATWSPMVVDGDLDLRQLARRPVAYPSTVPQVAFALHQHAQRLAVAELIPDLTDRLAAAGHRVAAADQRVQRLSADPAIIGQPDPDALLETARATWNAEQIVDHQQRAFRPSDTARSIRHEPHPTPQIDHGPSIGR
jgi:hypothetical protein